MLAKGSDAGCDIKAGYALGRRLPVAEVWIRDALIGLGLAD